MRPAVRDIHLVLCLSLLMSCADALAGDSAPRVWTSASGKQITASFVELQGDRVVLRTAEGRLMQIGLGQLGAEDQAMARRLAGAGDAAPAAPVPARPAVAAPASLPPLSVSGASLVDPEGHKVVLRGCNLGNWLLIEPWMLCLGDGPCAINDQYALEQTLTERFGREDKDRLIELFRSSWITERDFRIIRSFGMNLVRLPLHYSLFEDDAQPKQLKHDAWKWVDLAVQWAEQNGLYVILDMHGAQGGQNEADNCGRTKQNALWTSGENRDRFAWLWTQIAARYRDRAAVIAYDILNEPFGGTADQILDLFRQTYQAVRSVDPEKLMFAPAAKEGFAFYGDPKARGWHNVGLTMHFYPGLFGASQPTPLTHEQHLANLHHMARDLEALNVPFLVGEMNVVFKKAGGATMMRRYFDKYNDLGWLVTMWSYKAASENGGVGDTCWGLVTNRRAAEKICLRSAKKMSVEKYMKHFASEDYETYEELRQKLTFGLPRPRAEKDRAAAPRPGQATLASTVPTLSRVPAGTSGP